MSAPRNPRLLTDSLDYLVPRSTTPALRLPFLRREMHQTPTLALICTFQATFLTEISGHRAAPARAEPLRSRTIAPAEPPAGTKRRGHCFHRNC